MPSLVTVAGCLWAKRDKLLKTNIMVSSLSPE